MPYTYEYPAHYLTVDPVIFGARSTRDGCDLKILLIERGLTDQPFFGMWALPGGFVGPKESAEEAAARELEQETGVTDAYLEQLHIFSDPERDPRGRVVTIAFMGLVDRSACRLRAGTDAARAEWFDVKSLPPLAFDHADIVAVALERLRGKVRTEPFAFHLLPPTFTISELHTLCETVYGRPLDMPNFRRCLARMDVLREAGEETNVSHRPAKLYRFDEKAYARLLRRGQTFQL